MSLIGPALGGHADGGPWIAAILGRVGVGDDLDLFNGVDRWTNHLSGQLLHVLGYGVVVQAVENKIVLKLPYAMHVESARAAGAGASALVGVALTLHARHQVHQVVPAPQQKR